MSSDFSYAVPYSPSTVPNYPGLTIKQLHDYGIRFIRFQFADATNQVRYRVLPISYFEKILESPRPGITILKGILGVVFLQLAEGFTSSGEYLLVPDLSTLRTLPYKPGHASVLGCFEEKVPILGPDRVLSTKAEFCPRTVLQKVVDRATAKGVEFLVGFETEFILLTSTTPITTVHNVQAYSNSIALRTGSTAEVVLEEIAESLLASGIALQMYHPEAAPGQYEIVTGPLSPLQAADALVHTQQTIYNVASKHGLRATLAPRLHNYSAGSATHAHISVHPTGKTSAPPPDTSNPNLNTLEASFLAGLLKNFPAVVALTLPLPASYQRVADGVFSGGTYVCWGTDNREVPIRLVNATSPSSRNFEVKTLDGTANPYFALAAILGAGLAGIQDGASLTMKDCTGPSAAQRGEAGRRALGITHQIPLNWIEARVQLEQSDVLRDVLGAGVIEKYLNVNKAMAKALEAPEEEDARLSLLAENY